MNFKTFFILYIKISIVFFSLESLAWQNCGAAINTTGSQIGGGENYQFIPNQGTADYVVSDKPELLNAISLATVGDVIYIEDNATIELTGESNIVIPGGVTLASGRGNGTSKGALLYTVTHGTHPLFRAGGTNTRITGIRLRGPAPDIGSESYDPPVSIGIHTENVNGLEIDNSEVWAWSLAAVSVNNTAGSHIHHNHIHTNRRAGLGYGILVDGKSNPLIEANLFENNRHDIAGSGDPEQGYEARYNIVGAGGTSHSFDMHGENEYHNNGSPYAGDQITIHHNTFLESSKDAIVIRGKPKISAEMRFNSFSHSSEEEAIRQLNYFGNLHISQNCYAMKGWYVSGSAKKSWRPINATPFQQSDLRFGDFIGDDKTDVFVIVNGQWYVSESGTGKWTPLASSTHDLSELRFGDFTGDKKTDVFITVNEQWYASESAIDNWTPLASSDYDLLELRFGDFIGDEKTDVFVKEGNQWLVSSGGIGSWGPLATSGYDLSQLRFVDIVGDGKADVFITAEGQWYASTSATEPWQPLATSSTELSQLLFGNFVGDEKADVFTTANGQWYVSDGGMSNWEPLATSEYPVSQLLLGDFLGDSKTDVFLVK